jgi:hypothetical protein
MTEIIPIVQTVTSLYNSSFIKNIINDRENSKTYRELESITNRSQCLKRCIDDISRHFSQRNQPFLDGLLLLVKHEIEIMESCEYGGNLLRHLNFLISYGYKETLEDIFGIKIPCTFFWSEKDFYTFVCKDFYLSKDLILMVLKRMKNGLNDMKVMGSFPKDLSCCQCSNCEILFYLILEGDRFLGMHLSFKTKEELRSYNNCPFVVKFRVTRDCCSKAMSVPFWAKAIFPSQNATYALPDRTLFKKIKKTNFISLSNGCLVNNIWVSKFEMPKEKYSNALTDYLLNALVPLTPDVEPLGMDKQSIVNLADYYSIIYWLKIKTTVPPKKYLFLPKSKRVQITNHVYSWLRHQGLCKESKHLKLIETIEDHPLPLVESSIERKKEILKSSDWKPSKKFQVEKNVVDHLIDTKYLKVTGKEDKFYDIKKVVRYTMCRSMGVEAVKKAWVSKTEGEEPRLVELYKKFRYDLKNSVWRVRVKCPSFENFKLYILGHKNIPISLYRRLNQYKKLFNKGEYTVQKNSHVLGTRQVEVKYKISKDDATKALDTLREAKYQEFLDRYKKPIRAQKMLDKMVINLSTRLDKKVNVPFVLLREEVCNEPNSLTSISYEEALNLSDTCELNIYYKI